MRVTRNRRRLAVLSGVAALAAAGTYLLPSANASETEQSAKAGSGSSMKEVWKEDFDGGAGSKPSGDNWIIDKGHSYPGGADNWGTGEVQEYTDSKENVQLDGDGHLKITAKKDGDNWTSSRLETKRTDFAAPKGGKMRIEASLKLPNVSGDEAAGYWPAFWTLGKDFRGNYKNWPKVGEFDAMENVNGSDTTSGALHCGVENGGPCKESQGIGKEHKCTDACKDFHKYAIELDRSKSDEELRWYVDGKPFNTVKKSDVGDEQAWADATDHGHFILLNLAMGGAFPDGVAGKKTPTAATKSGGSLSVDYVSVESTGGASK